MTELTPDEFRKTLLLAAEAYDEAHAHSDAERLAEADNALQQAISDVRKQRQIVLANGGNE